MENSFIFKRIYYEAAKELSEDKRLEFYDTIMRYAFQNEEPLIKGVSAGMFALIKDSFWKSEYLCNSENVERSRRMRKAPRKEIFERDGYKCVYCGTNERLTLDHVVPYSKGGSESSKNLVTCCKACNSKKGARTPEQAGMSIKLQGVLE